MDRRSRLAATIAVVALIVGACGTAATPSPSVPASVPASTAASPSAPAASESAAAASPSASAAAVASVPADQLIFPDKLVVCSDLPYPPQEFFDDQGTPVGSDIEVSQEIARRLGLTPEIQNSVFDTIIAALQGNKCDIIASAQNITADRVKQVDMIPFFQAGQSFVVAKGNPKAIKAQDDLCGKTIAAETGTTEADYLEGTGDYKDQGLSKTCTDGGKPAIDTKKFQKDSDALLALQSGQVDAYFADSPVAGYYTVQKPDLFELSGLTLDVALEGISVSKDKTGLRDAVQAALVSMIDDGTYTTILSKYGLESGGITSDVAKELNKN
ncbi:MAG TPA: ABC transporter substrate-binding protein [Candidatus Limnocylindrales bacterium]|nr:ABC transporter substrate-binding protein [Candidatus Limnocylindrales bacterium]